MRTSVLCVGIVGLAIAPSASADEIQRMTVAQLSAKCTEPSSAAFCLGLATSIVNQLQSNGTFYMIGSVKNDTRDVLQVAGAACGVIDPKLALAAFIGWAQIHPENQGNHGLVGMSKAIQQAWPCKEHL